MKFLGFESRANGDLLIAMLARRWGLRGVGRILKSRLAGFVRRL